MTPEEKRDLRASAARLRRQVEIARAQRAEANKKIERARQMFRKLSGRA